MINYDKFRTNIIDKRKGVKFYYDFFRRKLLKIVKEDVCVCLYATYVIVYFLHTVGRSTQ